MKNENNNLKQLNEKSGAQIVFSPKNGKPGYRVKKPDGTLGQWIEVDKSQLNSPGLQADIDRYVKFGGKIYTQPSSPTPPPPTPPTPPTPPPADPLAPAPDGKPEPPTRQPAPPRQPAPQPARQESPVAKYMTAAAAARKSGDPAEMAKVRDMGMEIWAKANPRLAEVERLRNQQRAAGKSIFDKEFRDKVTNPVLYGYANPSIPGSGRSVEDSKKMFPDTPKPAPAQAPGNEKPGYSGPPTPGTETAPVKPPKKEDKPVKKEAYDIVLDYLFSEGHVDTLSEAHYVMMQMDAEHIQSIVLQERAWWDPAGVFMTKREKQVEKAKSTPTGAGGSYNPNTGLTYNPTAKNQARAVGVIAPKGGVVGTMEPGKPSTWQRYLPDPYRRQNIDRYVTVRGRDQLKLDNLKNRAMADKAKREAAATAAFDKKYGVNEPRGDEFAAARRNTIVAKPKPAAAPPKPVAAPVKSEKPATPAPAPTPDAPAPKLSKMQQDILDLRQMRANSLNRQGDIAGAQKLQTEIDMARVNNKMAATSPTPDAKPASSEVLKRFNKASADYSS